MPPLKTSSDLPSLHPLPHGTMEGVKKAKRYRQASFVGRGECKTVHRDEGDRRPALSEAELLLRTPGYFETMPTSPKAVSGS